MRPGWTGQTAGNIQRHPDNRLVTTILATLVAVTLTGLLATLEAAVGTTLEAALLV